MQGVKVETMIFFLNFSGIVYRSERNHYTFDFSLKNHLNTHTLKLF